MAGTPYREDQFLWTVAVDGQSLGEADNKSGGGAGSNSTPYPAPDGKTKQLGGRQTSENATFTYAMTLDLWNKVAWLKSRRGRGVVTFSGQPKNADYAPDGAAAAISENGVLEEVNPPDSGADSDDVGMLELVVSVNS